MPVTLAKHNDLSKDTQEFAPGIVQKDAITTPDTEKMAVSYYEMEPGAPEFNAEMPFEEIDYVVDGSATITDETGKTYKVEKGDFFSITKGSKISFSTEEGFKGVAIIHPCNWKEILANQ